MPKKDKKLFSQELINILSKATDSKIYGSVEIFFEAGSITQITQRIINKLTRPAKPATFHQTLKKTSTKTNLKKNQSPPHKVTKDDIPPVTRTP